MTGESAESERAARKESAWASLSASWEEDERREGAERGSPAREPSTREKVAELRRTGRPLRSTPGSSVGGGAGGLLLELLLSIAMALGVRLLWPVLEAWMSLRRAGAIVAGTGLGLVLGAFVVPRLLFAEDRVTRGPMFGALLKGEVAALLFAILIVGFAGGLIALFSHQRRAREQEEARSQDDATGSAAVGAGSAEPPTGPPGSVARRRAAAGRGVGDQIVAALVPRHDAHLTPEEFQAFLERQDDLSPKAWPRWVRLADTLPMTATNKILKRELQSEGLETRDELWERAEHGHEYSTVGSGVPA